ncbi:hypothetical protein DL768_000878 [Monosporascus sp. mg162]|nr:hypothetical protein DL768_000878 [Monosporascus sp. mg162]
MLPMGQTARAALTHCSQRPLVTLMMAPLDAAFSENRAHPDSPTMLSKAPSHRVTAPAMPPQMDGSATFWSWKSVLCGGGSQSGPTAGGLGGEERGGEVRKKEGKRLHVRVDALDIRHGLRVHLRRRALGEGVEVLLVYGEPG